MYARNTFCLDGYGRCCSQAANYPRQANTTSVRLARRAKIVLLASSGYDNTQIAEELNVWRVQTGRWRERYARDGLAVIKQDLPGGGRKPTVNGQEQVRLSTQTLPD